MFGMLECPVPNLLPTLQACYPKWGLLDCSQAVSGLWEVP